MKRGKTDAETCRLNGWEVGTLLVGNEGYGPTVIKLTAIGEEDILARAISHEGELLNSIENLWTLQDRNWKVFRGQP